MPTTTNLAICHRGMAPAADRVMLSATEMPGDAWRCRHTPGLASRRTTLPVLEPAAAASDEAQLIARVRMGDERAFEMLYLAHHDGLWRFAYGYVHSRDVAEELVQDVFLSLWGTRTTWEVQTRVRAWLFAAVRHLALNHLRHERVVARVLGDPAAPLVAVTMGEPQPDQHLTAEARELDEAMTRAIADLPERRRIAMTLRWKQDMSPLEIATVLGTTPESVRVLLSRARAELAALLARMEG